MRLLACTLFAITPLFAAASLAHGEDQKDPTEGAPVDLRPFQIVLPSQHLFGNWGGVRTKLEDAGIMPTLTLVSNFAGNVSGGESQGYTDATNIGLNVVFDLDKMADLKGASVLFQVSERWGESLSSEYIKNTFTSQQVFGGSTIRIVDVAYQQKLLDDRLEFRVGRIGASDDFLVSPYNYLFMQNAFDGTPVGIFLNSPGMNGYPNATWGAMAKVKPAERFYVMAGVYNGDPSIRDNNRHGVDLSWNGPLFAIGEVGYQVNGLPGDGPLLGNYKVGMWYDDGDLVDFETGEKQSGSTGFYAVFDQVVVAWGDPNSHRGLGVFGSVIVAGDPGVQQMPFFCTAGIAARGVFDARPYDGCGLAVAYGHFSDNLANSQEAAAVTDPTVGVQDYEIAIEATYRFNFLERALFVQPVVQYIIQPGGTDTNDDALVLGAQLGVNF